MSVWICIPSIRPAGGTLPLWKERGYRVAVLRQGDSLPFADLEIPTDRYLGWAPSINRLVREVIARDPDAEWLVGGGDDTEPANHTPEEIARECSEKFYCHIELMYPPNRPSWSEIPIPSKGGSGRNAPSWIRWSTFGVMQPTGDKALWPGSAIENFAGSPWMGREFCRRMYGGNGPLFEGYYHMFGDEELQCVAMKLGVFWQRPDLIHLHQNWGRRPEGARREDIPDFLQAVNTAEHWQQSKALFESRKAAGFPEHEPVESVVTA